MHGEHLLHVLVLCVVAHARRGRLSCRYLFGEVGHGLRVILRDSHLLRVDLLLCCQLVRVVRVSGSYACATHLTRCGEGRLIVEKHALRCDHIHLLLAIVRISIHVSSMVARLLDLITSN